MSKAAKQSIFILIALLLASVGYLGLTLLDKAKIQQAKTSIEEELESFRSQVTQQKLENKKLQDKLAELETKKKELEDKLGRIDVSKEDLDTEMKKLMDERDGLTKRVSALQEERDKLLVKLQSQPTPQVVYKTVEAAPEEQQPKEEKKAVPQTEDAYWAQVLKDKASLELELDKLKEQLSASSVDIVELKKQNSDLQLELSKVDNEKQQIIRDIKHGNDLADTLSLELARVQNDRKYVNDRYDQLASENTGLHEQIKQLTSTKIALEKSIVRLQNEKKEVDKKLLQTENVIQGRIDEIYNIKSSLEKAVNPTITGKNEIELPPIVVSSQSSPSGTASKDAQGQPQTSEKPEEQKPGVDGNVVSVNNENNFVILDVGEDHGLRLGDSLSVYRGTDFIGALEIIQLRKNIAAADIKTKVTQIQVGDVVR